MLPANEWWEILGSYGANVWPAQAIFFLAAVLIALLVFLKPGSTSNTLVRLYLALSFGWIGVVFFLALGIGLKGSYFFGSLFIIVAVLFAVDVGKQKMDFRPPIAGWQRNLTVLFMILILCYPVFSLLFGHQFPRLIVPGTFPCPTTALALLLLTFSLPQVNKVIYIILLFWAIPFPPLIQIPKYGVYEDTIMLSVGIYSLVMLLKNWKANSSTQPGGAPDRR
ncbi:DUF6064 family protein [Desulfurispirillum indicum]|uniref:DUF6064 family protein n=1 Tax=Desulfurispirillum indicum TaxID=936456 RepID=UPI001CFB5329|nr:DUF6064 family protein [Desulfurispirillum indicum]UCZ56376.1 DUF6064 family protein [Desulfurispirillum indicum]